MFTDSSAFATLGNAHGKHFVMVAIDGKEIECRYEVNRE